MATILTNFNSLEYVQSRISLPAIWLSGHSPVFCLLLFTPTILFYSNLRRKEKHWFLMIFSVQSIFSNTQSSLVNILYVNWYVIWLRVTRFEVRGSRFKSHLNKVQLVFGKRSLSLSLSQNEINFFWLFLRPVSVPL